MLDWLSKYKFQAHLTAFLLMVVTSIGMIFSMQQENYFFTWLFVAIFAAANLLTIFIK
jgi:hypothetical protein